MMGSETKREYESILMESTPDNYVLLIILFKKITGKLKFADAGIGFKDQISQKVTTLPATEIKKFQWLRGSRDYQLSIIKNDKKSVKFNGFTLSDYDHLVSIIQSFYHFSIEIIELSLKGWNWGEAQVQGSNLSFSVSNKKAFDLPLDQIANTIQPSKNEVSVEFLPTNVQVDGKNHKEDALIELRFFIPGTTSNNFDPLEAGQVDLQIENEGEGDGEAVSKASLFFETLKQVADLGTVQGDAIVTFPDLLCLVPRGRFEVELHKEFLRLRGKSHDYKVNYASLTKLFLLPKDDLYNLFVIGLDPPLRQGQTRYPFLVFQFEKEDDMECELNLDDQSLESLNLQKTYDAPLNQVISDLFTSITKTTIITPTTYKNSSDGAGFKCSFKANESYLYPLDKCFLSVPKPPIYIPHVNISAVTFSRITSSSTTKFFEIKFSMDNGTEYGFANIPREEYQSIEQYCQFKKFRIRSDVSDDAPVTYDDGSDVSDISSEEESERPRVFGVNDEDSESVDEDFVGKEDANEDSVNEEFDSEFSSSGSENEGESKEPTIGLKKPITEESKKRKSLPIETKPKKSKSESEETKKKSKPGPKRAMSSYMYFSNDKRSQVLLNNPGIVFTDVARKISELWKSITSHEKTKYEEMAKQDKARYEEELKQGVVYIKGKKNEKNESRSSTLNNPVPKNESIRNDKSKNEFKSVEFISDDDE